MSATSQTWKDVVREALAELGGQGHLEEINRKVRGHPKTKTNRTWEATVRRVVRSYTIFQPVLPHRSGVYKLVEQPAIAPIPESVSDADIDHHAIAQGMILTLGRLYGYETFAPVSDRTQRLFQGKSLGDYCTVANCSDFCKPPTLKRVELIDVIWLEEDNNGVFPRYAFEVEHSTGVRSGIDRLVEIPGRYPAGLFVVAPGEEEARKFEKLRTHSRYRSFKERLLFRNYDQLTGLYNAALRHDELQNSFGVEPRGA